MFPFVYGFEWNAGYLTFVGIFLTVATVVIGTLLLAAIRAARDVRNGKAGAIRWHSLFHDLPQGDRACRHDLTGECKGRVCDNGFDCRCCANHARLTANAAPAEPMDAGEVLGMPVPLDRYYHRGHTWAQPQSDGTILIGLDEMGRRMIGQPDRLVLPPKGAKLTVNAPAFRMKKSGSDVNILSPVDGTVVDSGEPGEPWLLKVQPEGVADLRHLLFGPEVIAWYGRELERLQVAMSPDANAPSLADGGVLVEDLSTVCPEDRWDVVCGEMFLDV